MENAAEALKIGFGVLVFAIALTVLFRMTSLIRSTSEEIFLSIDDTTYIDYSVNKDKINQSPDSKSNGKRIVGMSDIIPTIYRYTQEGYGVTIIDNNKIVARFDLSTEAQVASCIWEESAFGKLITDNKKKINDTKYKLCKYLKKYIYDVIGDSAPVDLIKESDENYDYGAEFKKFEWLNSTIKSIYKSEDTNKPVYTSWISNNRYSNNYITQRINCDLYGGTTYFNTKYPGVSKNDSSVENMGQHTAYYNDGLLGKYKDNQFIEFITEVDTNAYIIDDNGNVTELLQYGTVRYAKQREIIYVKK